MNESLDDSELASLVALSLRGAPHDCEALSLAERLIAEGKGRLLFEAFVRENSDLQEPVPSVMALLENVMDASPAVAAYLMARLYPVAGRAKYHEVFRAIELWMHNTASPDAARALLQLSTESVRPALKKACSAWAKMIRDKA